MSVFPEKDIFERLLNGDVVCFEDPQYKRVSDVVGRTESLISRMNASITGLDDARKQYSTLLMKPIPQSSIIFPPLLTNFGRHTWIGEGVTINHACSLLDMGGITIEDKVMVGPKVNLVTEGHPLDPALRGGHIYGKAIVLKKGCWIGAGATILPGVVVGENSVVAAGAVVNKSVPANVIVAGVPAKVVKKLDFPACDTNAAGSSNRGASM